MCKIRFGKILMLLLALLLLTSCGKKEEPKAAEEETATEEEGAEEEEKIRLDPSGRLTGEDGSIDASGLYRAMAEANAVMDSIDHEAEPIGPDYLTEAREAYNNQPRVMKPYMRMNGSREVVLPNKNTGGTAAPAGSTNTGTNSGTNTGTNTGTNSGTGDSSGNTGNKNTASGNQTGEGAVVTPSSNQS